MLFETVFLHAAPNQGNLLQLEWHSVTRELPESTSNQGTGFGKGGGLQAADRDPAEDPGRAAGATRHTAQRSRSVDKVEVN